MIGNELKVYDGLTSRQQLNLFRNLYYNDGNATEYGIIANAINDCFAADLRAYQRGFERGKRDNVCGFSAEDIAQKAENIAIDLEAMRTAANSYKMHYENARSEVAREIFEEIEQWLGNYNGCRVITYEKFDELKKKYTEDKK